MSDNYIRSDITRLIIKAFHKVYNHLEYGFREKVSERAMMVELLKHGLKFERQKNIKAYYDGEEVGDYFADLVANDSVSVELKAVADLAPEHEVQLVNYLKATRIEVGLLLNFGPEPHFKRWVFSNS